MYGTFSARPRGQAGQARHAKRLGQAGVLALILAGFALAAVGVNSGLVSTETELMAIYPMGPNESPREVLVESADPGEQQLEPTTGLGRDPAPSFPDKSLMKLSDWRKLVPGDHHLINGKVPPGIPIGTNSTILDIEVILGTCFVTWNIPGRFVGFRTPIHVHPRPQEVCVRTGAVLTMIDGRDDTINGAGECFLMPQMTKMANLAIGGNDTVEGDVGYTDFDVFRVPRYEPEWVVIEPDHLDLQGAQFVREDGCMHDVHVM